MVKSLKTSWHVQVAVLFFVLLTSWWVVNNFIIGNDNISYDNFGDFGEIYGLVAVWGSIWGLVIAKQWGGFKSVFGRALIMFSLGLLLQEFGQLSYAFYNDIYKTPGPYPSLGDVGYFGSIPFYIYGVILLGQASGIKFGMRSFASKIQAVIIPLVILILSYAYFLQGYEFDWSNPIKIFLDFGYPLAQSFYLSLAILIYLLSKNVLGGVMKNKILFILIALCAQFLADYAFLWQSSKGLYAVGGIVDYMYLVAYFLMTVGLLQLQVVLNDMQKRT